MTGEHARTRALTPDDAAHAAALAALDQMTVARLRSLLQHRSPVEAHAVATGQEAPSGAVAELFARAPELRRVWAAPGRRRPDEMGEWCARLGVRVLLPGAPDWPRQLVGDPHPPAVLFAQGDPAALRARRAGIVGTRNPTQRGRQTAVRFGHELAAAGVAVVSGLAKGVDGDAHRGVLAADGAPPIAVVANGHDDPYPRRHRELWSAVARRGLVLSEWPPGTRPDAFRFPLRNRILAALSEVVVVVESRRTGGSLITAREAAARGIDVLAVPGPVDAPASAGTNALIGDGTGIACDPSDVLVALGLDTRRAGAASVDSRPRPRGESVAVLEALGDDAGTVETVAAALGIPLDDAAMRLARLERDGWLVETGGWFEPVDVWGAIL